MSELTLGAAALATVLGLASVGSTSMVDAVSGVQLTASVSRADVSPRSSMVVSTAWLAERLGDPDLVLLHVGSEEGYAQHIPGARFIEGHDLGVSTPDGLSLEMPEPADLRARLEALGIHDGSTIVVYYGQGWVSPTTRIIFALGEAGLGDRTVLLDGGMGAWAGEGRLLSAEAPPPPRPGRLTVETPSSRVVDADFVRAHAGQPGYVLIDARAEEFFTGATPGGTHEKRVRGHIPGAVSLPYTVFATQDMRMESAARLAEAFAEAGVRPGDTVIAYCHVGQQATAILFAAQTLGYKVLLYDGAFEDWVLRDLPAETTTGA